MQISMIIKSFHWTVGEMALSILNFILSTNFWQHVIIFTQASPTFSN